MKMSRLLFSLLTVWCGVMVFADMARASTNVLSRADRPLTKEPVYAATPKYCLIALGDGDAKVWMVEDGRRLFVDKNANGDLTDDGPPIEPSNVRNLDAQKWDSDYLLDAITPTNGSRHTHFDLRHWNSGTNEDSYGLSLTVGDQLPLYAGWFGTFWSTNRETAPVLHFGGPFTPKLMRRKDFVIGVEKERLSFGFMNSGSGPGAESRLSIEALPRFLVPKVDIEWPTTSGTPLHTTHLLSERCCYWEYYMTEFDLPRGIAPGTAKVTVELPAGPVPIELTTNQITVRVVAKSSGPESAR